MMAKKKIAYLWTRPNRYSESRSVPSRRDQGPFRRPPTWSRTALEATRARRFNEVHARRGKATVTDDPRRRHTTRGCAPRTPCPFYAFHPMSPRWTAHTALQGGDFPWEQFELEVDRARRALEITDSGSGRGVCLGLRLRALHLCVEGRKGPRRHGPKFWPGNDRRRGRYLMASEWARFPSYILCGAQTRLTNRRAEFARSGGVHGDGGRRAD